MFLPNKYKERILNRSAFRYFFGYVVRLIKYARFGFRRFIIRLKGGKIGQNSIVPLKLALKANSNLIIGNDVSINSSLIDMRRKVIIKDNVIINRDVEIIRLSHDYNSRDFRLKEYSPLIIESYSWLATGCKVLPSCSHIETGTVIGAYSVLPYNTIANGVYSGFPAKQIKTKENCWDELVVVSLNGGDWKYYKKARKQVK